MSALFTALLRALLPASGICAEFFSWTDHEYHRNIILWHHVIIVKKTYSISYYIVLFTFWIFQEYNILYNITVIFFLATVYVLIQKCSGWASEIPWESKDLKCVTVTISSQLVQDFFYPQYHDYHWIFHDSNVCSLKSPWYLEIYFWWDSSWIEWLKLNTI